MVGHENLRFPAKNILFANDLHLRAADLQKDGSPNPGYFVDIVFRVGEEGKNNRPEREKSSNGYSQSNQ